MADSFHPQEVVTGRDFLNRKADLSALRARMEARVNVLLIAPRRFGKTSLIQEAMAGLADKALCLYVDLFNTMDDREMAEAILGELYRQTSGPFRKAMDWAKDHLPSLEVAVIHGPSGVRVELRGRARGPRELAEVLESLEHLGRKRRRPVVLALDEFQRVLERRDAAKTVATMRSVIQHQKATRYVLSGSKKHMLLGLVADPGQPFWEQLEVMEIGGIAVSEFAGYAKRRFKAVGKDLSAEALERVAFWCSDNPKRIQELLQGMLEAAEPPTVETVDLVARRQVDGHTHMLRALLDQVTSVYQRRVLRGLAQAPLNEAVAVFSAAFVRENSLGTPAIAQVAVRALQDQGFIDSELRFTDPYLRHHLASG